MNKAHWLVVVGVLISGTTWAAPDLSKLPPVADKKGVTYEKDIRPLFEASCNRCHGEQRQRGELRLDTLAAVLKGGENGKIVVPGKSAESPLVIAVAQIDDEKAMPPKRGGGGRGGPGGAGGRGGGAGMMLGNQMLFQGDKDGDKKLTKDEFTALAENWFAKLDPEKTGKVSLEQFTNKFSALMPVPQGFGRGPGGQPGQPGQAGQPGAQPAARPEGGASPQGGAPQGQRGFGQRGGFTPGRFLGPALFAVADADKDGFVTSKEWSGTFAKWFTEWDTDKSGSLDEEKLRAGLSKALPQPNFPGRGGPGGTAVAGGPEAQKGPGGQGGFGGQGGPGGQQSKPLTAEEVSLVRAWIEQGAK